MITRNFVQAASAIICGTLISVFSFAMASGGKEIGTSDTTGDTEYPLPAKDYWFKTGEKLLEILRGGGNVFYIRHFKTSHVAILNDIYKLEHTTLPPESFNDCQWQRPLSDTGVAEASAVGNAIRALQIPIAGIVTSPYCRNRESAELLAVGSPQVDQRLVYRKGPYTAKEAHEYLASTYLQQRLGPGENLVVVGHRPPMDSLGGIEEGETAVFRVEDNELRLIARIPVINWLVSADTPHLLGRDDGRRFNRTSHGQWFKVPTAEQLAGKLKTLNEDASGL